MLFFFSILTSENSLHFNFINVSLSVNQLFVEYLHSIIQNLLFFNNTFRIHMFETKR